MLLYIIIYGVEDLGYFREILKWRNFALIANHMKVGLKKVSSKKYADTRF